MKNYFPNVYERTLERILFTIYENFDYPDVAYSDFITRLDCAINDIAPFKRVRIKNNAMEWFDGPQATHKLYKNLSHQNWMLVNQSVEAQNTVQNLIRKKKTYFEEKLKENTTNPKKLSKKLKQLGLPEKRLLCTDVCLKVDLNFEPLTICELFKKLYSKLPNDFVHKLPVASKNCDIEAVKELK